MSRASLTSCDFGLTEPFDYLAVVPVVEEAGGCITDWGGKPLGLDSDGRILVTATAELHREALEVLRAAV